MSKNYIFLIVLLILLAACSVGKPTESLIATVAPTVEPTATHQTKPNQESSISRYEEFEVFCPTSNAEAAEAYNQAKDFDQQGNYAKAEELYLKAIKLDANYCDAMDNLGRMLRVQGRVEEAISWYKKSLLIYPENTVAIQNLALADRVLGDYDDAIENYSRLISLSPESPEGYFGLGSVYVDLQDWENAVTNLEISKTLYKKSGSSYIVDAQYYLGVAYFALQNCTKAKENLESIVATMPDDGLLNYVLGACCLISEPSDVDVAREYLYKAQKMGIPIPDDMLAMIDE